MQVRVRLGRPSIGPTARKMRSGYFLSSRTTKVVSTPHCSPFGLVWQATRDVARGVRLFGFVIEGCRLLGLWSLPLEGILRHNKLMPRTADSPGAATATESSTWIRPTGPDG